ncbi:transposase [Streptomyces yokosukanensis]|uniref:transposase n=1 Tax=Streptomyces yokosukanensis TaxID=67386 RepID=UPI001FC9B8ED|nr:transposase [Streptomyces yokosukanensis]
MPGRAPRILGIDEFASRKGRTCGTVLADIETSRPVDPLPDGETATVAGWLREHPGAEIVCRDRFMIFTKTIRQAVPDALDVADRWHLLQNALRGSAPGWAPNPAGRCTGSARVAVTRAGRA